MSPTYGPFWLEVNGFLIPKSDFRIGSATQVDFYTDLPVLRWSQTRDGQPFIPGSSLRGIIRAHLEREHELLGCSGEVLLSLFGCSGGAREGDAATYRGRLRVYDSIPDLVDSACTSLTYEIRDHVRIDRATGAARDQAKFDAERVSRYAPWKFLFKVVYEGQSDQDEELDLLHEALRALQAEELMIGSRSAIGCGRFRLDIASYRAFDRAQPQGLLNFLRHRLNLAAPEVTTRFRFPPHPGGLNFSPAQGALHRLCFELDIRCNGPLLVKAAPLPAREQEGRKKAAEEAGRTTPPDSRFVTTAGVPINQASTGVPYVPGSAFRGVLRHRAEHICTAQKLGADVPIRLFGSEKGSALERRGLVRIEDGVVSEIVTVRSDHVAVDRITHAAASGAKFDNEALSSPKVQFRVNVDFTNDFEDLVSVALLLALIQDLTSESSGIAIGSQTTRGYGSIETSTVTSIRGSFHGRLANVIQTFANEQQDRPRRTGFGSTNRNAGELFEALCGGFEDNWQKARLRAIIA